MQICDFGLAKWLPKEWTHHNVGKFEGTFGSVVLKSYIKSIENFSDIFIYLARRSNAFFLDIVSYFAPEYFMHGTVDEKTDVFSFGVLLLEIITGRQALDDSQQSLVIWVHSSCHVFHHIFLII